MISDDDIARPKLPEPAYFDEASMRWAFDGDQMNAHYLLGVEAGRAAASGQAGWQPIETAPEGIRVLLGPRSAPVVGTVSHPVPWQEGDTSCCVVHYNDNVLVAGYHCSEWMPLPAAPTVLAPSVASPVETKDDGKPTEAQLQAWRNEERISLTLRLCRDAEAKGWEHVVAKTVRIFLGDEMSSSLAASPAAGEAKVQL